jgi:hypothetical protein
MLDEEDTVPIEPTTLELAAVGIIIREHLSLFGANSLPEDMVKHLESFSAKVIQALEPTTYKETND